MDVAALSVNMAQAQLAQAVNIRVMKMMNDIKKTEEEIAVMERKYKEVISKSKIGNMNN